MIKRNRNKSDENIMQNRADILYGSDEEYERKYYSGKQKKTAEQNTLSNKRTVKQYETPKISDSEKIFYPNGTIADMPIKKENKLTDEIQEEKEDKIWQYPVDNFKISSYYGYRIHPVTKDKKFHSGIDIAVPVGTEVKAIANGEVIVSSGGIRGYGNAVYIDHGIMNGKRIISEYGHLSKMCVKVGQKIKKGQIIALSGGAKGAEGSGLSQGPHLHLTIREILNNQKTSVDPLRYINSSNE